MPRYLIEIPHSENTTECKAVVKVFLDSGSHLLSNADWGCKDGVHKCWFMYDFENKDEAMQVIPPFLRHNAKIVEVTKFSRSKKPDPIEGHAG